MTLAGDPLVDNALAVAATPYTDDRLQDFCQGHRVMICGSISDEKDLHICSTVANSHPDRRFIFVPHEVAPSHLHRVEASLTVSSCRMSDYVCGSGQQCNVLIVDHVGSLGLLYRYGAMAYIGGGFTSQLHSIIEATVYGLPAAFGPRTERKVTPDDLCDLGVGTVVTSPLELDTWYTHLHDASDSELWRLRQTAIEYCLAQSGATESIAKRSSTMDKQRLKTSIVTALAEGVSRLPMPVLYGISSGLSALMSRFRIYRYKVIEDNLRKAMPELSDRERKKVIKRYYGHLADSIVETLKLLSISDKELKEKWNFTASNSLTPMLPPVVPLSFISDTTVTGSWCRPSHGYCPRSSPALKSTDHSATAHRAK